MTDLVDYTLKLWRSTSFEFGTRDCMLSIGDYIALSGGLDRTALFRSKYNDEAGALDFVKSAGGAHELINATGIDRIEPEKAVRGDVVVIDTGSGRTGEIGALCTGAGIAARLERGVIEIDRRFIKITHAWDISTCQQ